MNQNSICQIKTDIGLDIVGSIQGGIAAADGDNAAVIIPCQIAIQGNSHLCTCKGKISPKCAPVTGDSQIGQRRNTSRHKKFSPVENKGVIALTEINITVPCQNRPDGQDIITAAKREFFADSDLTLTVSRHKDFIVAAAHKGIGIQGGV